MLLCKEVCNAAICTYACIQIVVLQEELADGFNTFKANVLTSLTTRSYQPISPNRFLLLQNLNAVDTSLTTSLAATSLATLTQANGANQVPLTCIGSL